jgi:septal ring factor EnvC (AmiA/AmiB activator)
VNEPTRDPRLLSADDIGTLTRLSEATDEPRWTSKVVRDLLAHIAAQDAELQSRVEEAEDRANELANRLAAEDQRHAALVEELVAAANEHYPSGIHKVYRDGNSGVRLRKAIIALAQPPGDE